MPAPLSFDPARTAILCMDYQTAILSIYAKDPDALLARAAGVLDRARSLGMMIVHVQVGFRPGLPEIGSRNPLFSAIKSSTQHRRLFEGAAGAIHPAVAPQPDGIVVTKHRIGAFAGTDLDMVLPANDIDTLVLFGIATSGVVLSTPSTPPTPTTGSSSSRTAAPTSIPTCTPVSPASSFPALPR
jgi:nicotinamidase-related amidase